MSTTKQLKGKSWENQFSVIHVQYILRKLTVN